MSCAHFCSTFVCWSVLASRCAESHLLPRRREIGRLPIRGVSRRSASVSGGVEVTLRQTKMLPPPRLPPPATRAPAARAGLAAATKLQPLRKRPCHTAQWPRALARTHRRLPFSLEGRLPSISCPWCADTRFVPCSLLRDRFCAFSAGGRFSRASSQEAFFLDQFCAPLALFLFFFFYLFVSEPSLRGRKRKNYSLWCGGCRQSFLVSRRRCPNTVYGPFSLSRTARQRRPGRNGQKM